MSESVQFVCYCHPEPQGSARGFAFQRANGKLGVSITSDNKKLKPFRQSVTLEAIDAVAGIRPYFAKHVPVSMEIDCYFNRPPSAPKKRKFPVVKPDGDKLARSVFDACTGVVFVDDAQVVEHRVRKFYGSPERVEVRASLL